MTLSIQDVRDYLMDSRSENTLLGDIDFQDGNIRLAMRLAAAAFNELPPLALHVSASALPLADWTIQAVQEQLYRMRLNQLERNAVQLQGGNVMFDEDSLRIQNMREALRRVADWRSAATVFKRRQDVANIWGEVG